MLIQFADDLGVREGILPQNVTGQSTLPVAVAEHAEDNKRLAGLTGNFTGLKQIFMDGEVRGLRSRRRNGAARREQESH